jgi:serine/threonine protein kinase
MAAAIKIGSIFAGYRIDGVLGRGGMGVVYLAEQPELGRKVAIKVIAPALASDPDYLHRFRRESRLAAAIEHPNAIPIYEAGVADEEVPYLVMRYVEGEDLSSLLRREGRLEVKRAAAIVDQIAGALDEAHARGLVHRDVKPANVIVESRRGTEHAYLTDFGLTREMDASSGVTATGRWVGTIDYASPEQIKGRPVDARCDVYALGCVLFMSLTGRLPFERAEDVAKLYAHVSEPPPTASSVVPDVPEDLDEVITRAMSKDPDFRFPSAGDFGRAAMAAATGTPVAEPEHTVATGEAAPATIPDSAARPAPTEPSEPPPTEPGSTVDAGAAPTAGAATEPSTPVPPAEQPAISPGGPPGEPPRTTRPAAGRRRLALLGGILAVGAAIAIAVVVLGGGGGGEDGGGSGGGGGGAGGSDRVAGFDFVPFTKADAFTVDAPRGWRVSELELPHGAATLTALTNPDQPMNVQIEQEDDLAPEERASHSRSERTAEGRYVETLAFEPRTVDGRQTFLYAYVRRNDTPVEGEQSIGEASIYNYFFSDGGFGWRTRAAVVTSIEGSEKTAEQMATEMAKTLEAR